MMDKTIKKLFFSLYKLFRYLFLFAIWCIAVSTLIMIIVYSAEVAFLKVPTILWGIVNFILWMILFCIIPLPLYMIYGFFIEERIEKIDKIISTYLEE